ncbi:MAG: thioesterase [Ilumatobacter sp.]|uniref:acyl-[acyl-carrier-protein] thioesterase n=1 Tax=Ilumatobacter sp. TaxID=1967498 RepID=UPI002632F936|nr:acyl-ACP thioesterase domain-containing protein [Ilumatobacter sp.]MDJ0770889.1 thioesterase [Ilumatobacter sp.]
MPATELLPPRPTGRTFADDRVVRLADADATGRLRLDAIARYLQDIASDDASDALLPNALAWVVRRTMIEVRTPAVLNERVQLVTFCTGWGRSWAERRTSITGDGGASIEAVSLWVQVDTTTARPARLGDEFFTTWGEAAGDRRVSSKLSLPKDAPVGAALHPWAFRMTDVDQLGHVNNAAQWSIVEEFLMAGDQPLIGRGQIEYLAPVEAGAALSLAVTGSGLWLRDDAGTQTVAAWNSTESWTAGAGG